MATKEPLRRCVRCKTKKKGCSRGSPCDRCALAGLTADECIYMVSDATFRNIKTKRKETTTSTPKAPLSKITRTVSGPGKDANAIVRCSRCIRTARGCSHERPCQPCKEGGLSEWECRYTSASSFKVRGPGARNLRKVKSMEKLPVITAKLSNLDSVGAITKVLKTERSHSTNSAPTALAQQIIDQIPRGYRTPSPPTNISPISEPPNWRENEEPVSSLFDVRSTAHLATQEIDASTIPGNKITSIAESGPTSMSRTNSSSGNVIAGSLEPPSTISLMPSRSQQSHSNTIPESSPLVFTDDYQSSPSPYNSPQFASSPPVHFAQLSSSHRPSSSPIESGLFVPQIQYRPVALSRPGHSRQVGLVSSLSQQTYPFQSQNQTQHQQQQQQSGQYQQVWNYAGSPPYPHYQQLPQHMLQSQMTSHSSPRHRPVASPGPRYTGTPSPYAKPTRQGSHEARQQVLAEQYRHSDGSYPQAIPARPGGDQRRIESFNNQSASSKDASPVRGSLPKFEATLQRDPSHDSTGDYEVGVFEQDLNWQDTDTGIFRQDEHF